MYRCTNCQQIFAEESKFCSRCGAPVEKVVEQPVPVPVPQVQTMQPVYVPAVPQQPENKVHLAKKIVSMALSIGGFVFAIIMAIYSFFSLVSVEGGIFFAAYFSAFAIPLAAVGLSMAKSNIKNGDTSKLSRLGMIFGIIALILVGASWGMTLLFALMGGSYVDSGYEDYYYYY